MKRLLPAGMAAIAAAFLATAGLGFGAARAEGTVTIGIILPYSGQFADLATQMDEGVRLYVKQYGDTVAGKKLVFIRKDTGGIAPDTAKRLAQELIVRDHADILAGFTLTPNALAAGAVSAEAKKFMVVMNAATSIIITKSPYMARTSFTTPMLNETLGIWATKHGIKRAYTMVSGYGPGIDAEGAFHAGFKAAGGEIVGAVRFPVANADFSAFVQRAKDAHPDAIYIWIPGGAQPSAVGKALAEAGVDTAKVKVLGQEALTVDTAIKSMGAASLGIITCGAYYAEHDSALNHAFVAAYKKEFGHDPDFSSVGAYDGMNLIYAALAKTGGNTDGGALIAAAKGMAWESPRGPMSIDPQTRDVVETVYIARVEKVDGKLRNVEFDKIDNVKDPPRAKK